MTNGQAFVGFREAAIDFPPTFKYDVLRTLGLSMRHKRRGSSRKRLEDKAQRLTSPDEREGEAFETEDVEEEAEGEAGSMASTFATSVNSRTAGDHDIDDDYFHASPSLPTTAMSSSKVSVAEKAKAKWMSLLSPLSPPGKLLKLKRKGTHGPYSLADAVSEAVSTPLLPPGRAASHETVESPYLRPPPIIFVSSTDSSTRSHADDGDGKGVYDTSHKKRVPSWYVCPVTFEI